MDLRGADTERVLLGRYEQLATCACEIIADMYLSKRLLLGRRAAEDFLIPTLVNPNPASKSVRVEQMYVHAYCPSYPSAYRWMTSNRHDILLSLSSQKRFSMVLSSAFLPLR